MTIHVNLSNAQIRVLSSVFSNLIIVWSLAMFGTRDPLLLTVNGILAILSWKAAVRLEEELQ